MRKLTKWACQRLRLKRKSWKVHQPLRPIDGFKYAPPAAYRHLREIGHAMISGDTKRVLGLQMLLAKSGYEVPTTLDEVADIYDRLLEQVNTQ